VRAQERRHCENRAGASESDGVDHSVQYESGEETPDRNCLKTSMMGPIAPTKITGDKTVDMCLGCGKKLKKAEVSLQFTVCRSWYQQECAKLSNEFLKVLEEHNTGLAYWACRPCMVYAQGMDHRMREMEKWVEPAEEQSKKNEDDIAKEERKMEKIEKMESKASSSVIEVDDTRVRRDQERRKSTSFPCQASYMALSPPAVFAYIGPRRRVLSN
jgi:hypothetical protein